MAKLAAAFMGLMEMPVDQATEEQQELQYAVFQLIEYPDDQQLRSAIGKADASGELQEKHYVWLEQVKSLVSTAKEFAQLPAFSGVAQKETAVQGQQAEGFLRPLIEWLVKLEGKAPSEQMLIIKDLTPQKAPLPFTFNGPPFALFHAAAPKEQEGAAAALPDLASVPSLNGKTAEAEGEPALIPASSQSGASAKADAQPPLSWHPVEPKPSEAPVRQVPVQRLAETLSEWIASPARLAGNGSETRLRINIFPEHLGHVEILVSAAGGKVSAQIIASHGAAKEAVELQLHQLRLSLTQQGVEIDKLEVREDKSTLGFSTGEGQREFTASQNPAGTSGKQYRNDEAQPEEIQGRPPAPPSSINGQVDYTV